MPIEVTHTEPGVYCTRWSGEITYADMLSAQDVIREHFDRLNTAHYVLVFDMSALPGLPLTHRQTSRLIMPDERMARTFIVGAPQSVRRISDTVSTIFKQTHAIEHVETMDAALDQARQIVRNGQAPT